MLDKLLTSPLTTSVADPPTSSASAAPERAPCCSDIPSNSTALGVVGMLRRLKLWTEGDAENGKLTILPSSIAAWLRSTGRYGETALAGMHANFATRAAVVAQQFAVESLVTHVACVSGGWQLLCSQVLVFVRL